MANELSISGSLAYADAENTAFPALAVANAIKNVTTKGGIRLKQTVTTTQAAVNLGGIAAPGWAIFVNREQTNTIDLKVATGGAIFAHLDADPNQDGTGGFALLKLGSGAQVPFCVSTGGNADMDILILPA